MYWAICSFRRLYDKLSDSSGSYSVFKFFHHKEGSYGKIKTFA